MDIVNELDAIRDGEPDALEQRAANEIRRLRECLKWLQDRHHGGLMRAKIDEALMAPTKFCNYPDCTCPFDHPGTKGWCARGYKTSDA